MKAEGKRLKEIEELFKDDIYAQAYGELFTDKIENLANVITQERNSPNNFTVFALEAGLGKSKYTNKIIDDSLKQFGNSKTYLVVKRFKEDVVDMETALSHHNPTERTYPFVLGITGDNWSKWSKQLDILQEIHVIIITHQRYINLCLDDEVRSAFSQNRDVLIIDEKINFPIYSFSEAYYKEVRGALPSFRFEEDYDKVCKKLRVELEKNEIAGNSNKCIRVKPNIHPSTLKNFKDKMEININNIKDMKDRSIIKNFMEGLDNWYNEMCIYNGGNIITFNRRHMLWGLKNNIILDASSSIDGVYHISENYNVIDDSRIIDHCNSSFQLIPFNSSKSSLKENQIFFKEITEKIKQYHSESDQTLIICHKGNYSIIVEHFLRHGITDIHIANETIRNDGEEHQEERVTQPFAINWFGNVIGKNAYADFTNCWVIGTPNISLGHYLMHYMMYAKQTNLSNKKLDIVRGNFINEEFNKVRNGFVASEIYQSLKRIQRNVKPNGNFFIVNSNHEITEQVLGQFKGTNNRKEIYLKFVLKKKEQRESNYIDSLIDYIRDKLPIGVHPKNVINKDLNINHMYRVLKADRVKALEEHGYIKINKNSIEKLKDWSE